MMVELHIVAGSIKIQKSVFAQEMLKADSCLRTLINWKTGGDFEGRHPLISKSAEDDTVTVDFNSMTYVDLAEHIEKLLKSLKSKYKEKIRGRVTCMGIFRNMFSFELDLNSDGDRIDYIPC